MTDTTTAAPAADSAPPKGSDAATGGALTGLRLPQLQAIATQLGVKGTSKMRKGDLLEAIRSHQGGGAGRAAGATANGTRRAGRGRAHRPPLPPRHLRGWPGHRGRAGHEHAGGAARAAAVRRAPRS